MEWDRPDGQTVHSTSKWASPSLAKPSVANTNFGQTKFGQYQLWPNPFPSLAKPLPTLAKPSLAKPRLANTPSFCFQGRGEGGEGGRGPGVRAVRVGAPKGGTPKGEGPERWGEPRKLGPRSVGPSGGPEGWRAKKMALFSLSRHNVLFSSLSWVSSRGILVVFEARGPSNVHVISVEGSPTRFKSCTVKIETDVLYNASHNVFTVGHVSSKLQLFLGVYFSICARCGWSGIGQMARRSIPRRIRTGVV